MAALQQRIAAACTATGVKPPSRASLYNAPARTDPRSFPVSALPTHVVESLYNLGTAGAVPGPQLAFYCFN